MSRRENSSLAIVRTVGNPELPGQIGHMMQLERERVIGRERARRWRAILQIRNELRHEDPDVRAARVYAAAAGLARDLPSYLREYVAWMRRLGFGESESG
jgi:hypothetical protein